MDDIEKIQLYEKISELTKTIQGLDKRIDLIMNNINYEKERELNSNFLKNRMSMPFNIDTLKPKEDK